MSIGILFDIPSLAPNNYWDFRTAPAERFQGLTQWANFLEKYILETMEKSGRTDILVFQEAQRQFDLYHKALKESKPVWPDPDDFNFSPAADDESRQSDPAIHYVQSSLSQHTRYPLATFIIQLSSNNQPFWKLESGEVAESYSAVLKGFKKLQKIVNLSLNDSGPASLQRLKIVWLFKSKVTIAEKVKNSFKIHEKILQFLAEKAAWVKEYGFSVERCRGKFPGSFPDHPI